MDKCYLDANLLIYFVQKNSPLHQKSISLLTSITESRLIPVITPLCIDEFLYHTHGSIAQKSIDLKAILKIPNLTIANPSIVPKDQMKVIKLMDRFKLRPRDAYHLLAMQSNKIKYFATFDSDFNSVFSAGLIRKFS
jgi:predicted nucleic acid-binding protein